MRAQKSSVLPPLVMTVKGRLGGGVNLACYNCGQKGLKAGESPVTGERREQSGVVSVRDTNCRRRRRDKAKQAADEEDHVFVFKVSQVDEVPTSGLEERGLMVDTGATSHIVTDTAKCKSFDPRFKPQKHVLELADGKRNSGIARQRFV